MRSFLTTKVNSAYDTEVNIKLLILWQLKEKDLQVIYSPKLEEVQRAQSHYISEEWSIQRRISVNVLLFSSTGRRHNKFLFPRIKEWNLQRLPGFISQVFLNCSTPKSLVGSLCPWTVTESQRQLQETILCSFTKCQIPPITPSSSCRAQ